MAQYLGTHGADRWELTGTVGNIVYGFGGNDVIFDSAGGDWMRGGADNDQFYSTAGSDLMFGGGGDDEFHLAGADANIMIRGGQGWDELILPEGLLAKGEADFLRYALDGVMLQLEDGGVLDIKGVEQITLV